jgi:hypothetical protein
MSHDDRDTTVCARAGELSFAIQMPMQANGAMPYLLDEVVGQVIRGWQECFDGYEPDDDDATDEVAPKGEADGST